MMRDYWIYDESAGVIVGEATGCKRPPERPGMLALDKAVYSESAVGAAPVWPRAYRNGLLAETDGLAGATDAPAAMREAVLARRAYLRALPGAHPSPLDIPWEG